MTQEERDSVCASVKASGMLTGLRWLTYEALARKGPMTTEQIITTIGNSTRGSISPRLTELQLQGLVLPEGEARRPAPTVWAITDRRAPLTLPSDYRCGKNMRGGAAGPKNRNMTDEKLVDLLISAARHETTDVLDLKSTILSRLGEKARKVASVAR